jgi:Flp pilus assembly protein TadG
MDNEDGSSIVETALSAMAVLALFLGVMEMSLALYTYHFISEAAREGTRYAMVRGSSCTSFASACPAQASDVQNYVRGLGFPGIVPANMTVTTAWPTTGASCTPSSLPCNNPGNFVQVTVQYQFPLSIPFVPSSTLPLTSTSQMAISQ